MNETDDSLLDDGQSGHENHEGQRFVNCLPNERLRVIARGEVDCAPDQNKLCYDNGFHGCKTPRYPMYPLAFEYCRFEIEQNREHDKKIAGNDGEFFHLTDQFRANCFLRYFHNLLPYYAHHSLTLLMSLNRIGATSVSRECLIER